MAPFSAIWRVVGRVRDILTLSPSSSSSSAPALAPATPGENNTRGSVDDTARSTAAVARRTTFSAGPVKVAKMAKMTLKWLAGRPATPIPTPAVREQERATNAGGAPVAISRFQPKTLAKSWTAAMFRSISSKVRIYSKPAALPPASPSRVHAPATSEEPIASVNLTIECPSNVTSGAGANRTFTSGTIDVTPPLTSTTSSFDSVVPASPSPSLRGRRTPVSLSLIAQPRTTIRLDITTLDADYDLRESGSSGKFGVSMDQSVKGTLGHEFTPVGFLPEDGALGGGSGMFENNDPEDIVLVDRDVNDAWLDKPINAPPHSAQTGEVDDDEFRYEEQEEEEEEEERFDYQEQSRVPDSLSESQRGFDPRSSIAQVEGWVLADLDQAAQSLDDAAPLSVDTEPIVEQPAFEDAAPLVVEPDSSELNQITEVPETTTPEVPSPVILDPLAQSDSVTEPPPTEPATPSPKPPTEIPTNPSSSASSPITSSSVTPSVAPSVSDSSSSTGRPRFHGIQSLVERRISQVQSRTSPSGASPGPAAPAGRDAFRRAVLQVTALRSFSAPRAPPPPTPTSINPESMRKATTRSMRKFGDIVEQERQAVEEMKASLAAIKEANKSKLSGSKDVTPPSSTKLSAVPSLPPVLEHEPLQQVRSPVHRQVQLIAREVSEEPKKVVGKPEPTPRKSQSVNNGPTKAQQPPEEKRTTEAFPALPQTSMLLAELPKPEAAGPAFQNGNLPSPFTEPENISPVPSPPPAPRQRQLSNGSPMNLFQRQMLEIAKEGGANFNNTGVGKENNNPPSVTAEVENVAPPRSRRRRTSNNTNSSAGSPSRQDPPSYASVATPKAVVPQAPQPGRVQSRPPPRRSATTSEQRPPRPYQQGQGQQQQQQQYPRGGPNPSYKQAATGYGHNGSSYSQHAPGGQNYNAPPINNNYAPPPPHRSFTARSNPNPPHYSTIASEPQPPRTQSFPQRPGQAQLQSQQQPPSSRPNSYSQQSQSQRPQAVRNRRPRQATFA